MPRAPCDGQLRSELNFSCFSKAWCAATPNALWQRLDAARTCPVVLVNAAGGRFMATPQGLIGWMNASTDTEALTLTTGDEGWLIAPSSLFHAMPRPGTLMWVNFGTPRRTSGPGSG